MHCWSVNDQSILAACSNGMLETCVTFTKTLSVGMQLLLDCNPLQLQPCMLPLSHRSAARDKVHGQKRQRRYRAQERLE
jgi:hypothetical protein